MAKKPEIVKQGSTPAPFKESDVVAMMAFAKGEATAEQQLTAFDWIVKGACAIQVWPYSESQRETDIALGRHMVAQQIMGILKVNISTLRKVQNG